jgi:hypothetical protein
MPVTITYADIAPFAPDEDPAKVQLMIDDALVTALLHAPCLENLPTDSIKAKAAKAIIRGAVVRWIEAGSGGVSSEQSSQSEGPFTRQGSTSFVTNVARTGMYWRSEIQQLKQLCSGGKQAFRLSMVPRHSPTFAVNPVPRELPMFEDELADVSGNDQTECTDCALEPVSAVLPTGRPFPTQPVTRWRREQTGTDGANRPIFEWTSELLPVEGLFNPGGVQGASTENGTTVRVSPTLSFEPAVDVVASDELETGGKRWQVDGDPAQWPRRGTVVSLLAVHEDG